MAAAVSRLRVQARSSVPRRQPCCSICYEIGLELVDPTVTHLQTFLTGRLGLDCQDLHPMHIAVFENQWHVVVALHCRLASALLDFLARVTVGYAH